MHIKNRNKNAPFYRRELFKTSDGLYIFQQCCRPKGDCKAVVVILHGYAEHSSCYSYIAKHLLRHNYAVYTFDLRGHGKSEGTRVMVRSFDDYISDLEIFLSRVGECEPGKPIFVLAHSMGGTIATLFVIKHKTDISGLILSSALLKIPSNISFLMPWLAPLIARIFPKLPLKKVDSRMISHNLKVVAQYDNDPLIYNGRMLAKEITEIAEAIKYIQANMEAVSLPLLILHGSDDHLVDIEGSRQLYARAKSVDKTLKLYKGFYHAIMFEVDKKQVLSDVVAWLNAHV